MWRCPFARSFSMPWNTAEVNDPTVYVTVTYTRADGALLFRVRDPGPGFSFDKLMHAAVSNPADSPAEHALNRDKLGLRPGGFGILLTRAFVDELLYNERGNEALLIKYLHPVSKTVG
jgi:anti-sigma regulatory factor (Ser/Thr protein kinase)